MSEQDEVQTDAEELASMLAGYNKTRGEQPPVEVEPSTEQEHVPETVKVDPAITEQPSVIDLAEELKALKAKVQSSSSDPDVVRRMHGEIGNINRTLKQMQTAVPPANDELSDALKDAEAVAQEFPELAGPLVKALKASLAKQSRAPEPIDIDQRVSAAVTDIRQKDALEILVDTHPDFEAIHKSNDYKTWLATKPVAYQERLESTWNPAVVIRGLDEFKESIKARERNKTRLAAAVAPQGMQQRAQPSTLPDDAGFDVGYNKFRKRQ